MVTGFDIIYFWVARMMKMGIHFMGEVPFRQTVIHGLVRDAHGRKMSKSLANAIDPLDVVEEHGADPLRLALIQSAAPGQDVSLDMERVVGARKFGNKVWNAMRFTLRYVTPGSVPADGGYPENPGPADRWILARLHEVAGRFDALCDEYRFSDAFGLLYNFAWSEVFDWYLEMAKSPLRDGPRAEVTCQTLGVVMRDLLKLFHPAIPYLTEELWQELIGAGTLAAGRWRRPPRYEAPGHMNALQELVVGIRRFRADHGLSPRRPLDVVIADPEGVVEEWWEEQLEALAQARPDLSGREVGPGHTRIVAGAVQGFIPLAGLIDLETERARLAHRIAEAESDLAKVERKLGDESFRERAPADVVAKEEARAGELHGTLDKLRSQLAELGD